MITLFQHTKKAPVIKGEKGTRCFSLLSLIALTKSVGDFSIASPASTLPTHPFGLSNLDSPLESRSATLYCLGKMLQNVNAQTKPPKVGTSIKAYVTAEKWLSAFMKVCLKAMQPLLPKRERALSQPSLNPLISPSIYTRALCQDGTQFYANSEKLLPARKKGLLTHYTELKLVITLSLAEKQGESVVACLAKEPYEKLDLTSEKGHTQLTCTFAVSHLPGSDTMPQHLTDTSKQWHWVTAFSHQFVQSLTKALQGKASLTSYALSYY